MGKEAINKRSTPMAGGWVDDKAGRLIDDDNRCIFIDTIERYRFGSEDRLWEGEKGDGDFLSHLMPLTLLNALTTNRDGPFAYEVLNVCAREGKIALCDHTVESEVSLRFR